MKKIRLMVNALGTVCEILAAVPNEYEAPAREAIASAREYLLETDDRLSVFKPDSEISRLNKAGLNESVRVSPDTFEILKLAKHYAADTNGIFDVTVGKSTDRWRRGQSDAGGPVFASYRGLLLEDAISAVRLSLPGLAVDLGGIAKGYVIDRIRKMLLYGGIGTAILNLGGTVSVIGKPRAIGLRNPFLPMNQTGKETAFGSLICGDEVIATSGIYEQSKGKDQLSHHIMNPQTGMPCETDLLSATVAAEAGVAADVYATTLIVLGLRGGIAFAQDKKLSVILVDRGGNVYVSEALRDRFTLETEVYI